MSDAPTTPDDKDRLISLPEAAEIYGFNPNILNLAQKGAIESTKSRDLGYNTKDVEDLYCQSPKTRSLPRRHSI
jgi:hypothetical protein